MKVLRNITFWNQNNKFYLIQKNKDDPKNFLKLTWISGKKFLDSFLLKPYRFEKIIYGFWGGFQPIRILRFSFLIHWSIMWRNSFFPGLAIGSNPFIISNTFKWDDHLFYYRKYLFEKFFSLSKISEKNGNRFEDWKEIHI